MTLEDFTTYTEVEPDDRIQKTANHIDFDAYENEDAYLYDDKGVDHFGNFEHLVTMKLTDIDYAVAGGVWAVSNDLDDFRGLETGNKTALVVFPYTVSVNDRRIYLREIYGGAVYNDIWVGLVSGTSYYLTIKKDGTTLTCKIYSDAARTDPPIDTLTLTLHADHKFRYIFGVISYNIGDAVHTTIDVDNLDLQEVVLHKKTVTELLGLVDTQHGNRCPWCKPTIVVMF